MKHKKILNSYIEEAYQLFSSYAIDKHLSVCDCGNCITLAEIEDLVHTPLRELTIQQVGTYVDAMLATTDKAIIEVHYFLPRMLEFLTERKVFYIDEGFSLSKCHFDHTNLWKPAEIAFLERFSLAFFEEILSEENFELTTAEDWLVCFGLGGLPIQPLLDCWTNNAHKIGAIRHFQEIFQHSIKPKEIVFHHIYFEKVPELNKQLTLWLNTPLTLQVFYKSVEDLLLSDIPLNEGLVYQLENMYDVLGVELKKR
ncbi:MAG: hypothetical protein Q3983_02090 [Capnocytophaga sp.]|nr:hypothetical protein [Capnocytophaga sp.]